MRVQNQRLGTFFDIVKAPQKKGLIAHESGIKTQATAHHVREIISPFLLKGKRYKNVDT